jgi:hypothetical protein
MQVRRFGISPGVVFSGEEICLKGVSCDEKMGELLFSIDLFIFFSHRMHRDVEGYGNSMSKMRFLL